MRLSWGLVLGLALGAQANRLAPRQDSPETTPPPGTTTGGGSGDSTTTTPNSSSPSTTPGSDTTVFVTATVTDSGGSTVSQTTTAVVSSVTTVTVTSTNIATTTVTKSDGETSTKTVYVTSTQTVNMKRSLDGALEFVGRAPAQVEAEPTAAPSVTGVEGGFAGLRRFGNLDKRAVVTSTVTVTVGGGGATTVFQTVTKSVKSTTTTVVQVTSFLTETYQANAKTTVTETSTIISKLTVVSTGATETQTGSSDNNNNGGSGNSSSDGLSTGAKAGIGVGAGVVGLAIIGAIIWLCVRRRRGPKPDPDDLLGPSSEVPVGAGGSRPSRPMSEGLTSTPGAAPRRSPVLPNVQPEGYRGTAMGDGRAGYAKPEPYGAAYAPTRSTTNSTHPTRNSTLSPGDQLPRHPTPDTTAASVSPLSTVPQTAELGNDGAAAKWHTAEAAEMATDNPSAAKWHSDNAHEIDSQPAMTHQSGPVYEMSTEQYR